MNSGYDGNQFQRTPNARIEAPELRNAAQNVCPCDVHRDYAAASAGRARLLDVGTRGTRRTRPGRKHGWIEGCERLADMTADLPDTRLVYVADREADMLLLIKRACDLKSAVDWLVRPWRLSGYAVPATSRTPRLGLSPDTAFGWWSTLGRQYLEGIGDEPTEPSSHLMSNPNSNVVDRDILI